jgi:hypothetical protein
MLGMRPHDNKTTRQQELEVLWSVVSCLVVLLFGIRCWTFGVRRWMSIAFPNCFPARRSWIPDIRCDFGHGTINWVDERVEQWLNPSIQMKRELKPEEHEEIVKAVAAGDRVKATSLYLSATEGDLTTAQNFIKTLIVEKQAAQSQQSAKERG